MFKKACNPFRGEKRQVGRRHLAADLGRHKACPYGIFEGMGEADLADGRGQAQGLPLPVF